MDNKDVQRLIPPPGTRAEYWGNVEFDTLCILYDKHGVQLAQGIARYNPKDIYNPELGCRIALGRAVKQLNQALMDSVRKMWQQCEDRDRQVTKDPTLLDILRLMEDR